MENTEYDSIRCFLKSFPDHTGNISSVKGQKFKNWGKDFRRLDQMNGGGKFLIWSVGKFIGRSWSIKDETALRLLGSWILLWPMNI